MTEFWDFYIELFTNDNYVVRIAAVTVTITVLTFLITFVIRPIYKAIKNHFAKIRVTIGINHQVVPGLGTVLTPQLSVIITNKDSIVKHIQNPSVRLPRKIDGHRQFIVPALRGVYPRRLEPGEQHNVEFDTVGIYNRLLVKLHPNDKIKITTSDTAGKKYYSNKMKVSHIIGHIELAQNLNN